MRFLLVSDLLILIKINKRNQPTLNERSKIQKKRTSARLLRVEAQGLVRITGIEPARSCPHQNLNLARLPVPPYPHVFIKFYFMRTFMVNIRTSSRAPRDSCGARNLFWLGAPINFDRSAFLNFAFSPTGCACSKTASSAISAYNINL